jgi:inner membrane protein
MIGAFMASPIGHALAGIAVAWGADLVPGKRAWRIAPPFASWYKRAGNGLTLACAVLAAAPDLDLPFGRFHRTATHSLISVLVVAGAAGLVAARARLPVRRVVIMCAAAWATHLLVDWLSVDQSPPRGIQLLWPFDATWFISGWDLFLGSERRQLLSAATMRRNVEAIAGEVAIMMPIVIVLWLVRVKALARLATQLACGDHPPK